MPVLKLTQELINNGLLCPEHRKHIELCDTTEVPGLYLAVSRATPGQGTYYVRYKNNQSKTRHQKIGRTTDTTLAEARKRARTLKAGIQLGADPRADERARKAVITLDQLFDEYLKFIKPRKRSWKRDEELYRLRIKGRFGSSRLNAITRQQVQTFHAGLLEHGLSHASADHHAKLLRRMFNLAVEWEHIDKSPITRLRLFHIDNRVENLLSDAQLDDLLGVLRTDPNRTICNIAMFLLSTGCRLNEALQAKWAHVDRINRVFRVPASNSKSKKVRSVPLNDSALEVIAGLDTEGKFEHLFVSLKTERPYGTIMKVWARLRKKAGLPHLRVHDLRHMYASFLVNAGHSLFAVGQALGHQDQKTTARYAHLSSKSLQEAANSASLAIRGSVVASVDAEVAHVE